MGITVFFVCEIISIQFWYNVLKWLKLILLLGFAMPKISSSKLFEFFCNYTGIKSNFFYETHCIILLPGWCRDKFYTELIRFPFPYFYKSLSNLRFPILHVEFFLYYYYLGLLGQEKIRPGFIKKGMHSIPKILQFIFPIPLTEL